MMTLDGNYFDGLKPICMPAVVQFCDREAILTAGSLSERFEISQLRVSPRIGSTDRFITFPNGGQFSCADLAFLDSLPQESRSEGPVAWLEARWGVAVACIAIIAAALLAGYFYWLPVVAERIAARIPMRAEQSLGRQTLGWLDEKGWLKPTSLDIETRTPIRDGFERLCSDLPSRDLYQLEFRSSSVFGPNAVALPGGIVVITDDMVKTAVSREEVLAVLAHEIGHVELRHTLRGILQGSAVAAAAAMLTSDASSLSGAVASFPVVVARMKYSREFEAAADEYAFSLLKRRGYSPAAFASIMERLARKEVRQTTALAYLSSHPMTAERVQRALAAAATAKITDRQKIEGDVPAERVQSAPAAEATEKSPERKQIECDVAALLLGDQVVMRREINKVFSLAKIYESEGKDDDAIRLFEKALEVNASNIQIQMELAFLLARHGRRSEAIDKANLVYELAEDSDLIDKAQSHLKNLGYSIKSSKPVHEVDKNVEIELIPLGNVNPLILDDLRAGLEDKMQISFTIGLRVEEIGPPDRSYKEIVVKDYIESVKQKVGEKRFSSMVAELGFRMGDLNTCESRLKFIYALYDRSGIDGQEARNTMDARLKKAEVMTQYNDMRLLQILRTTFPLHQDSNVKGYLAVTSEDLFDGESRFRFGGALPGYGVMSLRRFTSEFNGEDQNRPRLVNRALKQALSNANFILGIPRCTNPNCAGAYPSSLQELDRKPDTLCPLCWERLMSYRRSAADAKR